MGASTEFGLAVLDLWEGIRRWRSWWSLGWHDIRIKYRRSALGPFWITLSMAVTVYSTGFFYAYLFKTPVAAYFPYLATGLLVWSLISNLILDLTESFIEAEGLIKQRKLPYSIYPLRVVARNFLAFFHHAVAIVPIFFWCQVDVRIFSVVGGLLVLACYGWVYGIVFAMLGARFRDSRPIFASLLHLSFFLTPVMWMREMIPARFAFLIQWNPFYHMIEVIRRPLLGVSSSFFTLVYHAFLLGGGVLVALALLVKARRRIVFWL